MKDRTNEEGIDPVTDGANRRRQTARRIREPPRRNAWSPSGTNHDRGNP